MDLGTGLAIFGVTKALKKVLEPSAEVIGQELKGATQWGIDNIKKIGKNFNKKVKQKSLTGEEQLNPRVLKIVLQEGAKSDNELMAEYFGGVLASSLSEVSRDDRGASFAALVGRLTTYQIRAHYIFYNAVKTLFDGRSDISLINSRNKNRLEVFLPNDSFRVAMAFSEKENVSVILPSVMSGLARENLIERNFEVTGGEKTAFCGGKGIVFCPTDLGTELFLWVHGKGDIAVTEFLEPEHKFEFDSEIQLPQNYKSVYTILEQQRKFRERIKPEF